MNKPNKTEPWWGPGLTVFAEVTGWIVGPIIVALYAGRYFDNKYNSEPWFFLSLTAVAFFVSAYGIITIATRFIKAAEQEVKKQQDKKENENKSK